RFARVPWSTSLVVAVVDERLAQHVPGVHVVRVLLENLPVAPLRLDGLALNEGGCGHHPVAILFGEAAAARDGVARRFAGTRAVVQQPGGRDRQPVPGQSEFRIFLYRPSESVTRLVALALAHPSLALEIVFQ